MARIAETGCALGSHSREREMFASATPLLDRHTRGAIHGRQRQPRAGDLAPAPPTPATPQHRPRPQPLPAASRRAVRQWLAFSETVKRGVSRLGFLRSTPRRSATGPLSELAAIPQRFALRTSPATRPHNRSIAIPAGAGNLSSLLELRCGRPHRLVLLCGPSWARGVSLRRSGIPRLRLPLNGATAAPYLAR